MCPVRKLNSLLELLQFISHIYRDLLNTCSLNAYYMLFKSRIYHRF